MTNLDKAMLIFAVLLTLTIAKTMSDLTKMNTRQNIERVVSNAYNTK